MPYHGQLAVVTGPLVTMHVHRSFQDLLSVPGERLKEGALHDCDPQSCLDNGSVFTSAPMLQTLSAHLDTGLAILSYR